VNQDFTLPASGSLARKIVKLSKINDIFVDPDIIEMSNKDLITDFPADLTADEKRMVQELVDYKLRAVTAEQFPRAFYLIMIAAKIVGVPSITVMGSQNANVAISNTNFKLVREHGVKFVSKDDMTPEFIEQTRAGLLIMDYAAREQWTANRYAEDDQFHSHLAGHSKDYPMTVLMSGNKSAVSELFPNGTGTILSRSYTHRRGLETRGFKSSKSEDLMFLCNMVAPTVVVENAVDLYELSDENT
jgi:hypothetical protein